jgi:hypothetical protein
MKKGEKALWSIGLVQAERVEMLSDFPLSIDSDEITPWIQV